MEEHKITSLYNKQQKMIKNIYKYIFKDNDDLRLKILNIYKLKMIH